MIINPYYRLVAKRLVALLASILLTRLSHGLWLGVLSLMGLGHAFSGKTGKALAAYFIITCMVNINPIILPMDGYFGLIARFGPLIIGLSLMLKGISLRGQSRVPLGMIMVFLCTASISSINGWAPIVSYMKIINFVVFILGFWFGLHTLSLDSEGVFYLRATFMACIIFLIFGSAALLPFPAISTLSGLDLAAREGNVAAINAAMRSAEQSLPLFCGVTRQSQALAVLGSVSLSWLMADMLFVEKRFAKMHLIMVIIGVFLLYLSRSRAGLFSFMVGIVMVAIWLPNRVYLVPSIRRYLKVGISGLLILAIIVGAWAEVSSDSISQWIRKVEDVDNDTRSLSDAVTSSRQGLMESSMRDFWRNPMFGSGFQVAEYTAEQVAQSGSSVILSAPIEKGVLPVMVLGETGIVGAIAFTIFLISFYTTSVRHRLFVTAALFTVLLATNMGEATFFSPGGGGSFVWAICIIGGYCIDTILARERVVSSMVMR